MLEWLTVKKLGQLADALGVCPEELLDALSSPLHQLGRREAKKLR